MDRSMFGVKLPKQSEYNELYIFIVVGILISSTDAVTLTGSSEYAVPGTKFTLTCDVPEEANVVQFYRRPDFTTSVGGIQVGGGQCYNIKVSPPVPCTPDVCSCVTSGVTRGTVFRWIIQPQTGDHGSVWYCRRTNLNLTNQILDSDDYTLNVADGPGSSIALSPPDTTYTRTEGDTLPDITCTADCRPGCTFIWTRPDNTNFTVSPVLSLGQLDRSEHGTYRCTARNVGGESTIIVSITVQYGPRTSISLSPPNTAYTRNESDALPDVTCAADCRPGCTFVWTRPDNTNLTVSTVLSLGQLDRSEHGTYMCTARNVVGESTIITSVTVQCKPLPYQIPDEIQTIDLATTENLTILAMFTSNPSPSFVWTFQLPESTTFTQLKNGESNVLIQNTFETKNLTAVSIVTRTSIQQNWFGLYNVTATNTHGSVSLSFTVHEKRYPGFPNNLLIGCTKPHSAEVSWGGGGDSQYYHVMFSTDQFLNSQEVYPVTITKHTDGSDVYILNIDNLDGSRVYYFKVLAYNQYGNTTSAEAVGCTVQEPLARGTDSMFVAGIFLTVIAVVIFLFTFGLGVFIRRNGRLPFVKGGRKQEEFKNVQFSKRVGTRDKDEERFQSGQFDLDGIADGIAKVSTYSEIGGHHQVYQNDQVNGEDDRKYEFLEERSNPNVYEELQSTESGDRGTYANTGDAGDDKH